MTDLEFNNSLSEAQIAIAQKKLQELLDRTAGTMLHSAAVMARNAWVETINAAGSGLQGATDDAICKEMAAQLTALNEMVDRSAALTGDKA